MSLVPHGRSGAAALIRAGAAAGGRPEAAPGPRWDRHLLTLGQWAELGDRLAVDPLPLVSLWCDGAAIHALFLDEAGVPLMASVPVEASRYRSLSAARPAAIADERIVRDLWGVEAMEAPELRPLLDHGLWNCTAPLSARPGPAAWPPEPPEFLQSADEAAAGAIQLGIGPVQTLVAGPLHLRLALDGGLIVRLDLLSGFAHRGIARLMRGQAPDAAAPLAARIDAHSTVAHQAAFAAAVEAALGWPAPARAIALRALMAELERIAMHLHHLRRTLAAVRRDDAADALAVLREDLLGAIGAAFAHRLMLDAIVPGGLSCAPAADGLAALPAALGRLEAALPAIAGMLADAARHLSGRAVVADLAAFRPSPGVHLQPGDALSRCRWRVERIAWALQGAQQGVQRQRRLADEPVYRKAPEQPPGSCEGLAVATAAHGDVWHWIRLEGGRIAASHTHDPALTLFWALERAAAGMPRDELGLLCAALGLSVSGADQ